MDDIQHKGVLRRRV